MNGNPDSPHNTSKEDKKLYKDVSALNRAVFGDERLNEKGMKTKVDEMYEVMRGVKSGRKGVLWLGSLLAGIGTIIYFIKGGIK